MSNQSPPQLTPSNGLSILKFSKPSGPPEKQWWNLPAKLNAIERITEKSSAFVPSVIGAV